MTLSKFVKEKVEFNHVQIWLWVYLSKEKLTLDMSKYDFKYVFQSKNWLYTWSNITLSTIIKKSINVSNVTILTLCEMTKV
jgi:hypothetical protein